MSVTVFSAARHLCEKSGWGLSNLKLQKLLYLAHMIHLGEHNLPLINERFEAWDYGPVSPDLYHQVKAFGSGPIRNIFHAYRAPENERITQALDEVYDQVGSLTAGQLVQITHRPGGAWDRHYKPGVMGVRIPNEAILEEYKERIAA